MLKYKKITDKMKIRNKRTGEIREVSQKELVNYNLGKRFKKYGLGSKINKLGVENSLWNNIRENIGSGKKPTKQMLEQEAKINKMQTGGVMQGQPPVNFENVLYKELANRYEKGGLIAPNGNKSNLTPEQYKLVRTPEFKAWFGDWENDPKNASKVVDENGEPLVVYHGTKKDFYIFGEGKNKDILEEYQEQYNFKKKVNYFHKNKEYAETFGSKYGGYEKPFFLDIKKIEVVEENEIEDIGYWKNIYDYYVILRNLDGINSKSGQYATLLNPHQIKLADGTNTTFDSNNPDIRYEHGGGVKDITCSSCGWGWNKNESDASDLYVCHKCGTDNKMELGGELKKGIKSEKEHIDTAKKLYNREITPSQAAESIAREHLKEDPKYYSKMETIDFDKHYDEIKTKYANGGEIEPTYTLNTPSGDKSRLTYLQQVLVRTSAFKKFFGDWETASKNYLADNKENFKKHFANVSKVMDMSVLEPRVVYHGTQTEKEFFMFDVSKEKGMGRPYAYFAHNKEYSENFTEFSQRNHSDSKPFLYECFLNIRNPFMALGQQYETKKKDSGYWLNAITGTIAWDKYNTIEKTEKTKKLESAIESQIEKYLETTANDVDVAFWTYMARDTKSEFKYFLISYGYDGIFYGEEYTTVYNVENPKEYTKAVCVFTANDIKLANGKNLNFDPMNADIRYEDGGVSTPNNATEHNLTAKDKLGSLLFGEKYARGGTAKHADEIMPMDEEETKNNRRFVDELINKMKQ